MTVKSFASIPVTNEMKARSEGPQILEHTMRLLATRSIGEVRQTLNSVLKGRPSEVFHHPEVRAARWLVS